ncbi:hypothetical protein C8034_v006124 [Colletotrichum sidae]|uniref:Phosphoribosyltransferase domain-containing protein n=1 Tax=Colletotrichum sidae TaxID=1347389 RepID=A0A4R8TUT1_9PEZI|nr:hypothetical protein C8034_v006124 [Colletotrichum sidae]
MPFYSRSADLPLSPPPLNHRPMTLPVLPPPGQLPEAAYDPDSKSSKAVKKMTDDLISELEDVRKLYNPNPKPKGKPTIIGLYGVPGSGKSFVLRQLQDILGHEDHSFYEGAERLGKLVPGGMDAFKTFSPEIKAVWRGRAVQNMAKECFEYGRTGFVAGHYAFWTEGDDETPDVVYTDEDKDAYTHILYLDVPADVVAQRTLDDESRPRPRLSVDHIRRWQDFEKRRLRRVCLEDGILFTVVPYVPSMLTRVLPLVHDIVQHSEADNLKRAMTHVDQVVLGLDVDKDLDSMLVLDADRTITKGDTGMTFWTLPEARHLHAECPLKTTIAAWGFTYKALRQIVLLYEETAADFDNMCASIAGLVNIHPEFSNLLQTATRDPNVGAVIVTSGIRRIWEMVMQKEGFGNSVRVVGGGRVCDGYVVTPDIKGAVVARLRNRHGLRVTAFGDSPLDLPMLKAADRAVVKVGEEKIRSQTMDEALLRAIDDEGLEAQQALIPPGVKPRLTPARLPVVDVAGRDFVASVARRRAYLQLVHATDKPASRLLATPTRDAMLDGPALRAAHARVGRYLAREYLSEVLGLESYPITHVQGRKADGFHVRDEANAVVVALMRGGEPMAMGVNDVLPKAALVHARTPRDLDAETFDGKTTVLLVDSVVDSGKSVRNFVHRLRDLDVRARVVVVAGVVQKKAVSGILEQLAEEDELTVVALRLSDNKYTGRYGTDTGNRLYNTTHLA